MTTKAEALAVALDHAEETGEYSIELRERIADLYPTLRIAHLRWAGADEGFQGEATVTAGEVLCRLVWERASERDRGMRWAAYVYIPDVAPITWKSEVLQRTLGEAYAPERKRLHQEGVQWLRARMREFDWVLR